MEITYPKHLSLPGFEYRHIKIHVMEKETTIHSAIDLVDELVK